MTVEIDGVVRRFDAVTALDGVSLSLAEGEFVALLGPSGSGKTSLLRILAGLDFPDQGQVRIAGLDVAQVPARLRRVGVVFQHYALFRHMTAFENVAFGLRVRPRRQRPAGAVIERHVRQLLELMQIPELGSRYPQQISGGQRQRVALARALAIEPRLLLLDEPFGALDALVRKDVRRWVRGLHAQLGLTSILVTHDQEEAMEMADRVAVMERGRIVQVDRPQALLDAPATPFVAGFLGDAARLPARAEQGWLVLEGFGPMGSTSLPDGPVDVFLRPHMVRASAHRPTAPAALVRRLLPSETAHPRVLVEWNGLTMEGYAEDELLPGAPCALGFSGMIAFPRLGPPQAASS